MHEKLEVHINVWSRDLHGRDEMTCVDENLILKWILNRYFGMALPKIISQEHDN
jgi:hypothetical protein